MVSPLDKFNDKWYEEILGIHQECQEDQEYGIEVYI
jgi:hypothetical protein